VALFFAKPGYGGGPTVCGNRNSSAGRVPGRDFRANLDCVRASFAAAAFTAAAAEVVVQKVFVSLFHSSWNRGTARRGLARLGMARHGWARQGKARQGSARPGRAWRGEARQGKARQGMGARVSLFSIGVSGYGSGFPNHLGEARARPLPKKHGIDAGEVVWRRFGI
jgi:hypothetical protein